VGANITLQTDFVKLSYVQSSLLNMILK